MKVAIEFCIEIEAVDFLFKSIEPIFEAKEYSDLFLTKLQPFILCDKIAYIVISSDIILNLIDLYRKNGKLDILSQMLLHINIVSLDIDEIKKKIEELYLFTPLIYIYMNGQKQDYFTPLEKMFDYFYTRAVPASKILISEEDNSINYANALMKNAITPGELKKCKEYLGHKILWYIRYCLTGKKFPDEMKKMDKYLFDALVPKMTYWLLNYKVIDELLRFDPKNYFMIHKNIFSIGELRKRLLDLAKDSKNEIKVKSILSSSDITINDIQPSSLINYMVSWCKKKNIDKIYFYLYDFIINILNIEKGLEKNLILDAICFILRNYSMIVKSINNQEITSLNNNLIKILENEKKFNDNDLKNVLFSIKDNLFNELKLFLYDKLFYFDDYLKLFLKKDYIIAGKSSRLYKWINDKLKLYQKGDLKYDKLKEIIKDNSMPLASLSIYKFFELSKVIFQGCNKQIVMKLSEDQNIQLNYIDLLVKNIISAYENNENNVTNEEMDEIKYILGLHINLLCELKQYDKIIPALKACPFYPLKECRISCERLGAYQPCLFLLLKEGGFEKAFNLSKKKLDAVFEKLIKNINNENNDSEQQNLLEEFNKYLNDIKNICESNEANLEDLWFNFLDLLYKYELQIVNLLKKNEKTDKKKNINELYQNISKNIKELMERMSSFVSIKRILEEVSKRNKNAGLKEFKHILLEILISYSYTTRILDSARNLLSNLIFENEANFQVLNYKGENIFTKKCLKCKNEINNSEKIIIFNCFHIFHKDCISKYYSKDKKSVDCPICSQLELFNKEEEGKSLINQRISVIDGSAEKEDHRFQIKLDISAKKTLKKLERFDNKDLEKHLLMINNSINILSGQY